MYDLAVHWDDVRFFLAVARTGTLTEAARALRVSPPTVGRRVAALEASLGVSLFVRRPTGYTPTDAGADLLAQAEGLESSMRALARGAAARGEKLVGTVRVATFENLANHVVIPALPRFRRAHPGIALEIATSARTVGLTKREADLALRLVRPDQPGLVVRKIGVVGFALYAAKSGRSRARSSRAPDLARLDVVGWTEELSDMPPARWLAREASGAKVTLRTSGIYGQLAAAKAGLGAAVLPCFLGDADPSLRRLTRDPVLSEDLWLVQIPELVQAARVRATTDFLVRLVEEQRDVLAGNGAR